MDKDKFPLFSFGSETYPGLAKVVEECGEVLTIAGKLIMTGGVSPHFDGRDLKAELIAEMTDLKAALEFVFSHVEIDEARLQRKKDYFEMWSEENYEEFSTRLAEATTTHESTMLRVQQRREADNGRFDSTTD